MISASSTSRNRPKEPIVILIALDGFRWDYMSKADTPNMDSIVNEGVKAPFIKNAFPTVTMPNMYTIVTGLYPESHGIIANEMYDPTFQAIFDSANNESRWWNGGEPIWVTNQKHGFKSGVCYYPGYDVEIRGVFPSFSTNGTKYSKPFVFPYANRMPVKERVDLVMEWLNKEDPPNFIAMYFLDTDTVGHQYGPDSSQIKAKIKYYDKHVVGYLVDKLREVNLIDKVNIILTSDHGMIAYNTSNFINFDNIVNSSTYEGWSGNKAFFTIQPHPGKETYVLDSLKDGQRKTKLFEVYKRENVPESLHFKNNRRIASIVALMKEGWYIRGSKLPEDNFTAGVIRGEHGYNNSIKDMYPFFIARGPAFKKNMTSEPFEITDIYPLICYILGIEPAEHNGSLDRVKQLFREPPQSTKKPPPEDTTTAPGTGNKIVKIVGFSILGFAVAVSVVAAIILAIRWCERNRHPSKKVIENEETQEFQTDVTA